MRQRTNLSITDRCQQVLVFIEAYYSKHEFIPSYREIIEATGIKSLSHVRKVIDKLIENGDLEREPGTARGLRLPHHNLFSLPLKGFIAANNINPELVLDNDPHATIEILSELLPNRIDRSKIYALKVNGDSMKDALIGDGDTVLMKEGDAYNEGDIVAVWFMNEGAVTLKKIYQGRPGVIKLKPSSHKHHTRVEHQEDIRILGRIVGVIRSYN
jgi:repressor LexA